MKKYFLIWLVTFVSAVAPINLWYAFDVFIHDQCDPKFGCMGTLSLNIFIYAFGALILAFAVTLAFYFIARKNITLIKPYLLSSILIGILSSLILKPYIEYEFFSNDLGMLIGWFILAALLAYIVYLLQWNITNKHRS